MPNIFFGMLWGITLAVVLTFVVLISMEDKEYVIFDCLSKHTVEECKIKFDIKN